MENKNKLTLVLYPNTHGIGFVICENPKEIVDFGMKSISKRTHFQYLHKAKWLIEYASPHIVLLIDYHGANQKISKRQENILNEIADYATDHNINIKRYSRKQIRHTFSEFKSFTKYDIAMTLIRWYPQLKSKEPHKRLDFMSEHYQMGVFDAFALMITHYYLQ